MVAGDSSSRPRGADPFMTVTDSISTTNILQERILTYGLLASLGRHRRTVLLSCCPAVLRSVMLSLLIPISELRLTTLQRSSADGTCNACLACFSAEYDAEGRSGKREKRLDM